MQEIQERVQKAEYDDDYLGSVSKDLDLVKQVDSHKREARESQIQAQRLEKELAQAKKDLDSSTKKLIQLHQQPSKAPKEQVRSEPKAEVKSEDFSQWMA